MLQSNQLKAIDAIVATGFREDAARAAGVDIQTIRRWLDEPELLHMLNLCTDEANQRTRLQCKEFLRQSIELGVQATAKLKEIAAGPKQPERLRQNALGA